MSPPNRMRHLQKDLILLPATAPRNSCSRRSSAWRPGAAFRRHHDASGRLAFLVVVLFHAAVPSLAQSPYSLCPGNWTYYYDSAGIEGHDSCVQVYSGLLTYSAATTACR